MHEFGIAEGLLDAVTRKAREVNASRVSAIKLEIGVLSGIEIDALTFAFTAVSEGTAAEKAELKIEKIPVRCYCEACALLFECTPAAYTCPQCHQVSPDMRTGRELKLVSMEID
jgi:hydrogenase nickel incorporation protein HypA/HybF